MQFFRTTIQDIAVGDREAAPLLKIYSGKTEIIRALNLAEISGEDLFFWIHNFTFWNS